MAILGLINYICTTTIIRQSKIALKETATLKLGLTLVYVFVPFCLLTLRLCLERPPNRVRLYLVGVL